MPHRNCLFRLTRLTIPVLALSFTLGCSTPAKPPVTPPSAEAALPVAVASESSVDIQYELGRNHHHLWARSEKGEIKIDSFVDHAKVDEKSVDRARYQIFLKRASEFVQSARVPANLPAVCRGAFVVQVQIGKDVKSHKGCRNLDEGALSHLVRDGELLLVESDP